MNTLQILADNPLLIVFGVFCSLVGVFIGIFAMILNAKKRKKIVYHIKKDVLINNFSSTIKGIDIKHNNNLIESLCVSKIYIWNGGETLDKTDLHIDTPISIIMSKTCRILDVTLVGETDDTCKFSPPDIEGNKITTTFECLESGYGGIFQIMHTEEKSGIRDVRVKIKNNGRITKYDVNSSRIVMPILIITLVAALILLIISVVIFTQSRNLDYYTVNSIVDYLTSPTNEVVTRRHVERLMFNDIWFWIFLSVIVALSLSMILIPKFVKRADRKAYASLQELEETY